MPANRSVRDIIDSFVNELTSALEAQTTAAIREALGGGEAARVGNGRRAKGPKTVRTISAKNYKRSPEQLAAHTSMLLREIKKKPGSSIEELAECVGAKTKDLALPIRKLLDDKKIGKKGVRRGTRYTAR